MGKLNIVRFAPRGENSYYESVISAVNSYFETNKISPYGNTEMWIKAFLMISLFVVPYFLMVTGIASAHVLWFFLCWFLMGWGKVGIGCSVMHDANHGSFSGNKMVNNTLGKILEVIGGYSVTWKIQHNLLHHTYTNVEGLDEDIDSTFLLRFSPNQKHYWFHRFQHIYAFFFYTIQTLYWMTVKDYMQIIRYHKHDLLIKHKVTLFQALTRVTLVKLAYFTNILLLPILFSGFSWQYVIAGFLVMHAVAGLALSLIFQPAHVISNSDYAMPIENKGKMQMENSRAIHEVANTTNFAPKNKFLTWFIGGLNFQIEHHLFSNICHVHYKKLSPIVEELTKAHGIPYNVAPSFRSAIVQHLRMLKQLGKA